MTIPLQEWHLLHHCVEKPIHFSVSSVENGPVCLKGTYLAGFAAKCMIK